MTELHPAIFLTKSLPQKVIKSHKKMKTKHFVTFHGLTPGSPGSSLASSSASFGMALPGWSLAIPGKKLAISRERGYLSLRFAGHPVLFLISCFFMNSVELPVLFAVSVFPGRVTEFRPAAFWIRKFWHGSNNGYTFLTAGSRDVCLPVVQCNE